MQQATAQFNERTACINCGSNRLEDLCSGLFSEGAVQKFIAADPWGEHPAPFLDGKRWSYVRCVVCDQAFHRYLLTPEWNERRFSKWMSQEAIAAFEKKLITPARHFGRGANHVTHVLRIEALTRELRGNEPVRLLDFGCGYGQFLSVCSLFGFEATGVDRSMAKRDNGVFPVLPSIDDARGLHFHAVTLFEVLEHLDDPRPLLEELAMLLVPDGILVLETPNCEGITRIETLQEYRKIDPLEHINGFTPATLQVFAERLGFTRIQPPAAYVTTDIARVAKNWIKHTLAPAFKLKFRPPVVTMMEASARQSSGIGLLRGIFLLLFVVTKLA